MGIDHHPCLDAEGVTQYHVGRLASHPGQRGQRLHRLGHAAAMFSQQPSAAGANVPGFGAEKPKALQILFQFGGVRCRILRG